MGFLTSVIGGVSWITYNGQTFWVQQLKIIIPQHLGLPIKHLGHELMALLSLTIMHSMPTLCGIKELTILLKTFNLIERIH